MKDHEEKDPVTGKTIRFIVTKGGKDMSKKRATAMWHKEKGTIAWLRGMGSEDHLLDIGANVGVYTMFAAVVMGAHVTAMEPESLNFARLNQNIRANRVNGLVHAFPFAASDRTEASFLKVGRFILGHSGHQVSRETPAKPEHIQGTWKTRIDSFHTTATHIKIDVDGEEPEVIDGMHGMLDSKSLREIQCEIDTRNPAHRKIDDILHSYDFEKYKEETTRTDWMQNWRWRRG